MGRNFDPMSLGGEHIMNRLSFSLNGVFWREDNRWFVQLLETGLIGDGDTQDDAMESVLQALVIQIEETIRIGNPRNLFQPADPEFWQMFAQGKDICVGHARLVQVPELIRREVPGDQVNIESIRVRQYEGAPVVAC